MELVKLKSAMVLILLPLFLGTQTIGQESFVESLRKWFNNLMELQERVFECLAKEERSLRALTFKRPGRIKRNIDNVREFVEESSFYVDGLIRSCIDRHFPNIEDPEDKKFGARVSRFSLDMAIKAFHACRNVKNKDWDQCVDKAKTQIERKAKRCFERNAGREDIWYVCMDSLSR